jgi:acetyl esterase/lipase
VKRDPWRLAVVIGADAACDRVVLERFLRPLAEQLGASVDILDTYDVPPGYDGLVVAEELAASVLGASAVLAVLVDVASATEVEAPLPEAFDARIRGRGIDGYRWAVRHLIERLLRPFVTESYGEHPDQVGDLRFPDLTPPHPVVMLLHGGGWKEHWRRDLMDGIAVDLAARGYATWNVEYRRVGTGDSHWPETSADVRAALAALHPLAGRYALDLDRLVLLGHSAGGQLALWAAAEAAADPAGSLPQPTLAVSVAGVLDLAESSRRGLIGGDDIAARFLGGLPREVPDRYRDASPLHRVPLGVSQLVVQGLDDYLPDLVDFARRYVAAATAAGDDVALLELRGVDHLQPVDPRSAGWARIAEAIAKRVPTGCAVALRERGLAASLERLRVLDVEGVEPPLAIPAARKQT